MRAVAIATSVITSCFFILPSFAAPKGPAAKAETAVCKNLSSDYESASKAMAMNEAEGMTDDSAIRENVRESQNNGSLEKAKMTLDLMHGNGCKLPTSAPGPARYLMSAMTCKTALLQQSIAGGADSLPDSCDQSKWEPMVK